MFKGGILMSHFFRQPHPFEIIKEKCEKVFRGKYRIFDEDIKYNAMADICIQYTRKKSGIENLNAWLNGAIHYHYCDFLTALKKNKENVSLDLVSEASQGYSINMLNSVEVEELKSEILNLDYPYNKIMYYRVFEDMSHQEISEKLGIKLLTVRKYYSRTVNLLKKSISVLSLILFF